MTAITFDTLKFGRALKASGIPEAQGEAELATAQDIIDLRRDINDAEQWLFIRLGGLIAVAAGVVAALVKLL